MLYTARIVLRILLWVAAGAATAWCQHSTVKLSNPFQTPQDRAEGAAIFKSQCASCHGADGKGGNGGTDLTRGQFKHAVSEEAMFRVINKGVPGTTMPGFALNGAKVWQVMTYIASLNVSQGAGGGNARRGAELAATLGCARCHAGDAPDLAVAAARMSRPEMRQALLEPGAEVATEYWSWRGTLRDARVVEGRRLNEDTFSIQVKEKGGRLRTIAKSELAQSSLEAKSTMPSFQGKLAGKDLEDVLAYLESLREGRP
jgi:cytochrome c oxidase cbb3-type subunit III